MPHTVEQNIPLFADFPPALPPANVNHVKPVKKRRRISLGITVRLICLAVSVCAISVCAYQKLNEVLKAGIVQHIGNELIGAGKTAALENVGNIAFNDANSAPIQSDFLPAESPMIKYVPIEQIKNALLEAAILREKKLAALYSSPSKIPENTHLILPSDYSAKSVLELKNDTSFSPDMKEFSKKADSLPTAKIGKDPLVLIVHTHGTESFAEDGKLYYSDTVNYPRSEDVSKNIVAVGKVLCDELNKQGIPTIHCETMHDKDSYINAYDRSAESIKYYIEKYPSIEYIFDVHRDSLIRTDLVKLKPVTLYDDLPCAQIMMIIGSNEKGGYDYDWEGNLLLAEAVQKMLFKDAAGVARNLYLRGATYNQQYAKHGLLLEIGSCGNTLSEAKTAAKAFAKAFSNVIK